LTIFGQPTSAWKVRIMKEKPDLVSIVMLSFNRKNDVQEGLQELLKQNYKNMEIIVVDNGSTDGTPGMVKNKFPEVTLITLKENLGVAAYNKGFQQAQGKYIVILDDDSFPGSNAIPRMVEEFEKNEKLGVVAFDVRNYYDYKKTNLISETNKKQDRHDHQTGFKIPVMPSNAQANQRNYQRTDEKQYCD